MPTPDASSYKAYNQDHSYESDLGYCVMPVAGRSPKFRRIRLHGGIAFRRVKWEASRAGKPPIIPQPVDVGNDLILSYSVVPSLPAPNPDMAGYNWTVRGEYLYLQSYMRDPSADTLPTGGLPFAVANCDQQASVLASSKIGQAEAIVAANLVANGISDSVPGVLIGLLGQNAISAQTYLWPFTAFPSAFSDPSLIGV